MKRTFIKLQNESLPQAIDHITNSLLSKCEVEKQRTTSPKKEKAGY